MINLLKNPFQLWWALNMGVLTLLSQIQCRAAAVSTSWTWGAARPTSAGPGRAVEVSACPCLRSGTSSSPSPTEPSTFPTGTCSHSQHLNKTRTDGQVVPVRAEQWNRLTESNAFLMSAQAVLNDCLCWWIRPFVMLIDDYGHSFGCLLVKLIVLWSCLHFTSFLIFSIEKVIFFW